MAEVNRNTVVYSYGAEGRDACWAALTNSWNDYARRQIQFSSDESWTPSQPAETGEIDSTTTTAAVVTDMDATTTPPPPPMMKSPPKIKRPRRSTSARNEWSCVFRLDLDLADSCVAEVDGGRERDRKNDTTAAAAAAAAAEDEWSSAGCDPEDLRPLTPASLPGAEERQSAAVADEDEWTAMTAIDAYFNDEPRTTEFDEEETITAVVTDLVVPDEPSSSLPSPPPTPAYTGGGTAYIPNEQQTVDKPPPSVTYEMKIKEIDDTIVWYSKSLLITVLVVVLIRILF